jgi:hypothetical protein
VWEKTSHKDVGHVAIRIGKKVYGYYPTDLNHDRQYDERDLGSIGSMHVDNPEQFRRNYLNKEIDVFGLGMRNK